MSGFHEEPREIHVEVGSPMGFIHVTLSSDGVNEGFTVHANLNGTPVAAWILDDEDEY